MQRTAVRLMSLLLCVGIAVTAHAQPDPLQARLDDAVAAYNQSLDEQVSGLDGYVRGRIAKAEADRDIDAVEVFTKALEALSRKELPALSQMQGVVRDAKSKLLTARNKLRAGYDDVIADYTMNKNLERARAVKTERDLLDVRVARDSLARIKRPVPIPAGAVKWPKDKDNGHHYKLFTTREPISWTESQQRCRDVGGHLACGESEEELAFLFGLKGNAKIWLGATRLENGKWQWLTGAEAPHATAWIEGRDFMATTQQPEPTARIARKDDEGWCRGYICEWDE